MQISSWARSRSLIFGLKLKRAPKESYLIWLPKWKRVILECSHVTLITFLIGQSITVLSITSFNDLIQTLWKHKLALLNLDWFVRIGGASRGKNWEVVRWCFNGCFHDNMVFQFILKWIFGKLLLIKAIINVNILNLVNSKKIFTPKTKCVVLMFHTWRYNFVLVKYFNLLFTSICCKS